MEQDFFTNLPSELTTNILSRLPIRSVAISKCVCKPWFNLLDSHDFVKSHLSKIKTPPSLARLMPVATNSTQCTIFEFEDEDEADVESHALRFHPLTDFEIPLGNSISKCRAKPNNGLLLIYSSLERRTWRRVEPGPASGCSFCFHAYIVCNGNPHWTVYDSAQIFWICAFDLETECFSIFSAPAVDGLAEGGPAIHVKLNVLRGCLCLSYTLDNKVVIWLMKEYRVQESWTMEYQISIDIDCGFVYGHWNLMYVYPIKVFENGDVLMSLEEKCLIYYSNKTRTIRQVGKLTDGTSEDDGASALIYTPSLFSLKNFAVENVILF
ncbi:F-box protein-like protein [Salvia divinorum]|uniref:F-box protein-like protein n=1 Tax=Salvia divinorum TaxID=28513 RepID=A0ABD1FQ10_SALDI